MAERADVDDPRAPQLNEATVLLYPFREMRLVWWDDYLHSISSTDRAEVMVRVMDCLMAHALLHEDPYLEEAVVQMGQKIPTTWSGHISHELVASFEIAHHIFKTICVTAKFPSLETTAKVGLLKMSEQRIQEIEKAVKQPSMGMDNSVGAAVRVVLTRMHALRQDMEARNAFVELMDAMKELFFAAGSKRGVDPPSGSEATWFDTFVCCEGCPCCARLRTGPTIYLRDIERAKIIDCVMMCAVKQDDSLMRGVTTELIVNHCRDYMENPALDDLGRQVQNGKLFYCRTGLFHALSTILCLSQCAGDNARVRKSGPELLDRGLLFVLWVRNELKDIRQLHVLVPCLDRVLSTAEALYPRLGQSDCKQDLHTIEEYLTFAFRAISAPEYHLAVHSRDVFVGKPADMKCANPTCPGVTKDLLKCSGCDVTYYCSPECQKADWEKHKNFCHEIESRRARPTPIPSDVGPTRCIKPRI